MKQIMTTFEIFTKVVNGSLYWLWSHFPSIAILCPRQNLHDCEIILMQHFILYANGMLFLYINHLNCMACWADANIRQVFMLQFTGHLIGCEGTILCLNMYPIPSCLTHWPLGDLKIFFKMSFSNSYPESIPWAIPAKLLSEVCHRTPLMISQHWFR